MAAVKRLLLVLVQIIRLYHEREGGAEKSVPRDHRLASLGKPRDANQ